MKRKQQDDTVVSEVQQDDTVVSEVQPVGCTRQCPEADESGSEVSMGLLPMVGLVYREPFAHHAASGSKDKELLLTAPKGWRKRTEPFGPVGILEITGKGQGPDHREGDDEYLQSSYN